MNKFSSFFCFIALISLNANASQGMLNDLKFDKNIKILIPKNKKQKWLK